VEFEHRRGDQQADGGVGGVSAGEVQAAGDEGPGPAGAGEGEQIGAIDGCRRDVLAARVAGWCAG
jgi:hypothetical protein